MKIFIIGKERGKDRERWDRTTARTFLFSDN